MRGEREEGGEREEERGGERKGEGTDSRERETARARGAERETESARAAHPQAAVVGRSKRSHCRVDWEERRGGERTGERGGCCM